MVLEGRKEDPLQAFRFLVSMPIISKSDDIGFATVSGLNSAVDVIEYREGKDGITNRKMPGLVTFDNVTFTRGMLKRDTLLFDWFNKMNDVNKLSNRRIGLDEFRTKIRIDILGRQDGIPYRIFFINNAFPVNLSLSDLDANSGDAIIKTLEVAHEGIEVFRDK